MLKRKDVITPQGLFIAASYTFVHRLSLIHVEWRHGKGSVVGGCVDLSIAHFVVVVIRISTIISPCQLLLLSS